MGCPWPVLAEPGFSSEDSGGDGGVSRERERNREGEAALGSPASGTPIRLAEPGCSNVGYMETAAQTRGSPPVQSV